MSQVGFCVQPAVRAAPLAHEADVGTSITVWKPARHGATRLHILPNVPRQRSATRVAQRDWHRWTLEPAWQQGHEGSLYSRANAIATPSTGRRSAMPAPQWALFDARPQADGAVIVWERAQGVRLQAWCPRP